MTAAVRRLTHDQPAVGPLRIRLRMGPRTATGAAAESRWLSLYLAARLAATGFAAGLVVWGGMSGGELLLLLYGPLSTVVFARPEVRRRPAAWVVDSAVALGCVLAYGDWRSPFYLLWLMTLVLPATSVAPRRGLWLGGASSVAFLVVAVIGGPAWGALP